MLTAVVEEHTLVDGQDAAAIHYVTREDSFLPIPSGILSNRTFRVSAESQGTWPPPRSAA